MLRTGLFFLSLVALPAVPAGAQTKSQSLDLVPHPDYAAPPPATKNLNKEITTRERDVTINGVAYREIQYKGQLYKVNLRESDQYTDCTRTYMPQDSFAADASFKVTKRTALFIESLRQQCDEHQHMVVTSPDIHDTNIGVKWKDKKNSEKAVLVNPLKQMGSFRTDF